MKNKPKSRPKFKPNPSLRLMDQVRDTTITHTAQSNHIDNGYCVTYAFMEKPPKRAWRSKC